MFAGLAAAQLQITTSTTPQAYQYQSYYTVLTATGGTLPYTWSVVTSGGAGLPEGMSLDAPSGTVSAAQVNGQGGYAVTFQVTDSGSPSPATVTRTLNIGVHSDASYGGCPMFPADSIYNQRADQLPVDSNAGHQIPAAYLSSQIHPDFGTGFYPGPGGMPFLRVANDQVLTNVNLAFGGQLETAGTYAWPFPRWPNPPVEGTSYGQDGNDHHLLILQTNTNNISGTGPQSGDCLLYETYNHIYVPSMWDAPSSTWFFGAGVHYDLSTDLLAASIGTLDSAANDSAGIPIVPLLIRFNEVPLGTQHPLRMTFPVPTDWFVWPATGCCSGSGPPQGLLYRLKASVNWQAACPVTTNPQAATVLQALQQYGAYMSDHGAAGYVGGVPDDRWNDADLACIKNFLVSDLEVVDNSMLEVLANSGQTQPYVIPALLPNATFETMYTAVFSAVGGTPGSLQWSVAAGALPPGVLLNATTGAISGLVTSSIGSPFTFSLAAQDTVSGYTSAAQPFTVTLNPLVSQTITFGALSNQVYGAAAFAVSGTASSGLPLSFNSQTTAVCTVAGALVTLVSSGACTIQATQPGNATYAPAPPVNQSFQVLLISQTVTFGTLSNQTYGAAPFTVSAIASSGLSITFSSQTPAVCSVTAATVTLLAAGTCTVQAAQSGNSSYAPATGVNQSFQVAQEGQTITFAALSSQPFGSSPFTVTATSTSGLAVTLASQTTSICTVTGTSVTLLAAGSCTLQATQTGTSNYFAANPVSQSFPVTPANQTIAFGSLSTLVFGAAPFSVSATASSGLAVSFNSQTTAICTVTGATVNLLGAGTCTIQATQAGNTNYAAANPVNQNFLLAKAAQTITFAAIADQTIGAAPPALTATATSGLTVSFISLTTSVCTLQGAAVTLLAGGTCTVQAVQAGSGDYFAATSVMQSFQVVLAGQTIVFATLPSAVFGSAPFTIGATATSGLTVSFNSQSPATCTVFGTTVNLAAVGTCTIQATQAGNGNYSMAAAVSQSFQVTGATQTIAFGALPNQTFGTSVTLNATASSGLPISFNSQSAAVCTVTGSTVTLVTTGVCTIQATQPGSSNYFAAAPVSQSFSVLQESQTITSVSLSGQTMGTPPFTVSASASSGLPVSFNSQTPPVCTVAGNTVTLVAVGICTIQATQAGNANYAAATPVNRSVQINQGNQTITFSPLFNQLFGAAPFALAATASSGLAVSFSSTTPAVCTVSGFIVTLIAGGTCTIQAAQTGNPNYLAANPVNQSFQVTAANQTITFSTLAAQTFGAAPFLIGAASSGLPVSFNSQSSAICTVAGATVTLVSAGTCTIQAAQPGNASYAAATAVNQSFPVTPATQTISFPPLSSQSFGVAPYTIGATASSGLAVSFNSQSPPVCTLSGATVTVVAIGICTIQATQPGNAAYASASPVSHSFQVTQGGQTITFGSLANQLLGAQPFTVNATASSGLTVTFSANTPAVCTVSGKLVTLVASGTCTIQASQSGNQTFNVAPTVNQSFVVSAGLAIPGSNSLSFPNTLVGKTSATLTVTLQNGGNAPLTIASIALTGIDAANYHYLADPAHPCPLSPGTLAAGAFCTLDVTFAPISQGAHTGAQIAITDNSGGASGSTQNITLTGIGTVLSTIAVTGSGGSLAINNSEQFTATGTYSDASMADLSRLATWTSTASGIATINSAGLATAVAAGQTNIGAVFGGVTSNSFSLTVSGAVPVISAFSGGSQSAIAGTAFAAPLQAVVRDSLGNALANTAVTFTAPASGAGGSFANGLTAIAAVTNSVGLASSGTFTANATSGSYSVTAAIAGGPSSASFALTNMKGAGLSISLSHTGNFTQWQSGATYSITVANAAGGGATSGTISVTEATPAGMTLVSMIGGATWNCTALPVCTTNAVLAAGSSYPPIVVTFNVAGTAATAVVNQASVTGGASASDPTAIYALCDFNQTGSATVADVQIIINQALGISIPTHDLDGNGVVNIQDIQIEINAALGLGCSAT